MPPARSSVIVTFIAVFNLVGGFLGLIFTLFSLVGVYVIYVSKTALSSGPLDLLAIQDHVRLARPEYQYIELTGVGIGFLFDLMLLASGFGLIWRWKWARYLALTWAVMSFCNRLFMTCYSLLVIVPTMREYIELVTANQPPNPTTTGLMLGGYIGACGTGSLIVYPVIVFCLLLGKSAVADFEPRSRHENDYEDEDYFRDRPRSRYRDDDRLEERDERN